MNQNALLEADPAAWERIGEPRLVAEYDRLFGSLRVE